MKPFIQFVIALAHILIMPMAGAQVPDRNRIVIGILSPQPESVAARNNDLFFQALEKLGYQQGRNLVIEGRYADGSVEMLPALAAELVALKPDIILSGSPPGALAAAGATKAIPIVAVGVNSAVLQRLVQNLTRPGGNITGFTVTVDEDIFAKYFELLTAAVPGLARVGILFNESDGISVPPLTASLGLTTKVYKVRTPDEIESAIVAATRDGMQAMNLSGNVAVLAQLDKVAEWLLQAKMPAIYLFPEFTRSGGFMSYGSNLPDIYRRAAEYVDRILKGAKPGDLPIQQPTKFDLVVNLKTARAFGIQIPQSFLLRADEVIE